MAQRNPGARVDPAPQQGTLVPRKTRLLARRTLGEFRHALVEPERAVASRSLPEDRMGVLVEEERSQPARGVARRHHVDAPIEKTHGLEGKAVAVGAQVGRLAVEFHAERLCRHRPDPPLHRVVGLLEKAQHHHRVVRRGATEGRVVVDAEVGVFDVHPVIALGEPSCIGQATLIVEFGELAHGRLPPGLVLFARRSQEGAQMNVGRLVAPAQTLE